MRRRDLLHPLPLSAIAVLVLNDHVLKHCTWAPRALTGKLSDFAGLFFFPVLLVELARAVRPVPRRSVAVVAALATAIVFAAIKLEAHANAVAAWMLGSCARDPSDLVALPMTALAVIWSSPRDQTPRPEGRSWARTAAMVVASLASMATSRPYRPPCPAVPTGEVHRSWDSLCARTPGASVLTSGAAVFITFDVTPSAPGCVLPGRGFAIDQSPRPDLSARTITAPPLAASIAPPPSGAIDQTSRLSVQAQLPYPAACDGLRLGLLVDGGIVDLPILSCRPKEAP